MQHQSLPLVILSPTHPSVQHNVPFGQPQSHPRQLAYGFGMSPQPNLFAPPAPAVGSGWASSATQFASPRGWGGAAAIPTTQAGTGTPQQRLVSNSRRRRRSESSEGNEETQDEAGDAMDTGASSKRVRNVVTIKKVRVGVVGNGEEETFLPPSGPTSKEGGGADLGKALASLSKESLLTLLSNLLVRDSTLKPIIQSLLPPPTLSSTLATLSSLEKAVQSALPSGDKSVTRENYVWGRVRVPLEGYILESKSFLLAFCPSTLPPSSPSGGREESLHHPSTTFSFLSALTSSLRRLELVLPSTSPSSSPSPLSSHLLPYLLNAWHLFLTRLSASINTEGRMISAQVLRSWFDKWDELSAKAVTTTLGGGEGPARKAMMGVRDRAKKEVGWVVGLREVVDEGMHHSGGMMEEEEEL